MLTLDTDFELVSSRLIRGELAQGTVKRLLIS